MRWSACTGCASRSACLQDRRLRLCMGSRRGISDLLCVSPICLVDSLFALLALTAWWCHRLNCQQLTLELSRWPVLASGIVCQQTLQRYRRRLALSPLTKNLSIPKFNSPFNLIHSLGGPYGDIHLGHLQKIWIELNQHVSPIVSLTCLLYAPCIVHI